jgi:hypothetical protein
VLTPIEESSLLGTAQSDPRSIMCYQLPGSITKDGKPIIGGTDIDAMDAAFIAGIYPKKRSPTVAKKALREVHAEAQAATAGGRKTTRSAAKKATRKPAKKRAATKTSATKTSATGGTRTVTARTRRAASSSS